MKTTNEMEMTHMIQMQSETAVINMCDVNDVANARGISLFMLCALVYEKKNVSTFTS